jgi:hypothetical protein
MDAGNAMRRELPAVARFVHRLRGRRRAGVVALIDPGIDPNHQDLTANLFRNTADCNSNGVDDDGNR